MKEKLPGEACSGAGSLVHFMKETYWRSLAGAGILILVHFMKENYLEKPCSSWNLILVRFMKENYWRSLAGAGILILVHFMKENYLEKPCGSWNPYPSAFYEGELPGEALRELESLS